MLTKKELPKCPVTTTVQLIGNKWKLLILQRLLEQPWRFNELQKSIPGISQKVLADCLRSMEADGIIIRTVYLEIPPHVEYSLSELDKKYASDYQGNGSMGFEISRKIKRSELNV